MDTNLKVISWNVTRRCNLDCKHCYLPADFKSDGIAGPAGAEELSTEEARTLINQISSESPEVMLILSGGEPLLREDIYEIAEYASGKGMMVVVGTNGLLLNDEIADRLKKSGVSGLSISLDSASPEVHDEYRLTTGAWDKAVKAIKLCRAKDLSVQVNTVVTQKNYLQLPEIIEYARSLDANVFSPFFLVCTGRGEELTDISAVQYEEVLSSILNQDRQRGDMMIRTRCAPTSRRILHQKDPDSSLLKLDSGKCMAGIHYCRITPEGAVTPCPYMQVTAGNIKETAFNDLWQNSDEFSNLRNPALKGKCGRCEYKKLCGGCRARAIGKSGDIMDQDPWCAYIPAETEVIEPPVFTIKSDTTDSPSRIKPPWTDDAEARLKRIPFFVRAMVKGAVEKFALDNNHTKITPEVMAEARKNYALGRMSKP